MCDSILKVGNKLLLHKLKCSKLSRSILTGEITTRKFTILFRVSFTHGGGLQTIYYETCKKNLPNTRIILSDLSMDIHYFVKSTLTH